MIDRELADEGAALLSTAIAELIEGSHEDAVIVRKGGLELLVVRADRLKAVGADIEGLARAMEILAKRSAGKG